MIQTKIVSGYSYESVSSRVNKLLMAGWSLREGLLVTALPGITRIGGYDYNTRYTQVLTKDLSGPAWLEGGIATVKAIVNGCDTLADATKGLMHYEFITKEDQAKELWDLNRKDK